MPELAGMGATPASLLAGSERERAQSEGEGGALAVAAAGPQAGAAREQSRARAAVHALAKLGWSADDQRPQLVQGGGASLDRARAGNEERPQGPRLRAQARRGACTSCEQQARGALGIECVGPEPSASALAPWSLDLEHLLAAGDEEARSAGAVGTGSLERPGPASAGMAAARERRNDCDQRPSRSIQSGVLDKTRRRCDSPAPCAVSS